MYTVRRMHHHQLVAVFYVCPIPTQAASIKQTIMAKKERDAPKAQVQSYFVFSLYFGDGVQRYSHLTYLSMNNKCSVIYRYFAYLYTKGIEHHKTQAANISRLVKKGPEAKSLRTIPPIQALKAPCISTIMITVVASTNFE